MKKLSNFILNINKSVPKAGLTISQIMKMFKYQSCEIILFTSLIPLALPIPLPPGVSTIVAIPSIIISFQLLIGAKKIWLPSFISNIKINKKIVRNFYLISKKYIQYIESKVYNRFAFFSSKRLYLFNRLIIFTMCILAALPLPIMPTVFALSACIVLIGLIIQDGLFVLIGWLFSALSISMVTAIGIFLFKMHGHLVYAVNKINAL